MRINSKAVPVKALLAAASVTLALAGGVVGTPARAAGCIKGAIVGGVAGHFVHHGVLGAAAGCVVGRANANRRIADQDRAYEPAPGYQPNVSGYQQPQPYSGPDPRAYNQQPIARGPDY